MYPPTRAWRSASDASTALASVTTARFGSSIPLSSAKRTGKAKCASLKSTLPASGRWSFYKRPMAMSAPPLLKDFPPTNAPPLTRRYRECVLPRQFNSTPGRSPPSVNPLPPGRLWRPIYTARAIFSHLRPIWPGVTNWTYSRGGC